MTGDKHRVTSRVAYPELAGQKWLVCPGCRAVSDEGGTLVHEVGCAYPAEPESYGSHAEALARGVGLWFASLRGTGPDRGDTVQPVDYTDPYFKEGR